MPTKRRRYPLKAQVILFYFPNSSVIKYVFSIFFNNTFGNFQFSVTIIVMNVKHPWDVVDFIREDHFCIYVGRQMQVSFLSLRFCGVVTDLNI